MHPLALIHPLVSLGDDSEVGPFVVLGEPPRGRRPGELPLSIGSGATIRSHTVIYAGCRIGRRLQTGHGALIREGSVLGDDCSVGSGAIVEFEVTIGGGVRLHSHAFVPEHSILEDGCWIGPHAVLTNSRFPRSPRSKETLEGVRVGRHAIVGAHATILPGVTIGARALVAAGSVVTHDVGPGEVWAGHPARSRGRVVDLRHRDTGLPAYPDD